MNAQPPSLDVAASAAAGPPPGPAPLVATKLRAPVLHASFVGRARLDGRLDAALDEATRLTLVSAPPGYGKSVAVLGWLRSRGLPHAWLSLEPSDNDPVIFVRYLVAALRVVRPDAGRTTLSLIGAGTSPSAELIGATILDEIAATDDRFALILDDYHAITAEPVHAIVRFLVEHGPPFARLILLTREDPPLPLARLRAHARLAEIRADELRYTADEAAVYLAGVMDAGLAADDVARLLGRTEGWVAGLQLAALSLRGRPDRTARIEAFHGSHRFILDYLADEILDRLDPDLRTFLVRTSVADRFTAELCAELTGRSDAEELLRRAEHANLFLVPLDGERRWFRYHHLFGEYLRSQLDDDERRDLHRVAASHLERAGLVGEAIGHALAAGDTDRAVRLIAGAARPAFEAGELSTLLGWVDALPSESVVASPDLGALQAWALFLAGRLPEAAACAERGLAGLPASARGSAPEGRYLSFRALALVLTSGDVAAAEPLARAGLEGLDRDPFFRTMALLALAEVRLATMDLLPAVSLLREALVIALPTAQPMAIMPTVYLLTVALGARGARDEAEALCRQVLARYAGASERPLRVAGLARIALGTLRYEANNLVGARRELEQGFESALSFGFGRFLLGQGAAVLATVRRATGAGDAATDAVKAGARHARALQMQSVVAQAGAIEALALLERGDVAGAGRLADQLAGDTAAAGRLIPRARLQRDMALARIRLAQGRLGDATALLASLADQARASGADAYLASILVLQARVADESGHRPAAAAALREAVSLAAPGGYVRRLVEDGAPLRGLLESVRADAPAFVDAVLLGIAAESGPAGDAAWGNGAAPDAAERRVAGPGAAGDRLDASGRLDLPRRREPVEPLVEPLTARELDVLRLMARGTTNAGIAAELVVSLATAKWHVGNVLGKLGVTSRTQALVRGQQLGLV